MGSIFEFGRVWLWPSIRFIVVTAILKVVLAQLGIVPEDWVARVFSITSDSLNAGVAAWLIVGVVGLALTFVIEIAWEYLRHKRSNQSTGDLDNKIEFGWSADSNPVVPVDGKIHQIHLAPLPDTMITGGPFTYDGIPGSRIVSFGQETYACRLTNHWTVPIFNFSVILRCVFKEAIENAKSSAEIVASGSVKIMGSGEVILDRPWQVSGSRIQPGTDHSFLFYLSNPNKVFVHVFAPETISFQRLGSGTTETARLIRPRQTMITFSPPMEFPPIPTQVGDNTASELPRIAPGKAVRDTKMHLALAFIETGKWGGSFFDLVANPGPKDKGFSPAELRQAALDGDIRVWGKLSPNGVYELISPKHWKIWQIDWFSALKGTCETKLAVAHYSGGQKHYDLMVSKTEVEAKWPPKN